MDIQADIRMLARLRVVNGRRFYTQLLVVILGIVLFGFGSNFAAGAEDMQAQNNFFSFDNYQGGENVDVFVSEMTPIKRVAYKNVIDYEVSYGDSLWDIAANFGISTATIQEANGLSGGDIRPGQKLVILPTDGIYYHVKKGDTVAKIAHKYRIKQESILAQNDIVGKVSKGDKLVLPGAREIMVAKVYKKKRIASLLPPEVVKKKVVVSKKPTFVAGKLHFVWPTTGKITQYFRIGRRIHRGLDIANGRNTPIVAAESGVVVKSYSTGWNGGYGRYILIKHANGYKTRYAHMERILVRVGQKVRRGQKIGLMGNSGRVRGRTGIHLHFEVIAGRRVRNPLAYLR